MEQLNLYDYYEHLANNPPKVQKAPCKKPKAPPQKLKPQKAKKRSHPQPKVKPPELVFSIGKRTLQGNKVINDAFAAGGEFGMAKMVFLRECGLYHLLPDLQHELFRGIKYVRGDYAEKFQNLADSVVSFGFTERAARRLKALVKEYRRRNIRLKIDVAPTEVNNV